MKNNRYIVIVECGRLGSLLANQLSRAGNSVVVIDRNEATFNDLSFDFSGFRVEGDATQMVVLKEAKLNKHPSHAQDLSDAFSLFRTGSMPTRRAKSEVNRPSGSSRRLISNRSR
jgi:voltage-gated potassium channel Kch